MTLLATGEAVFILVAIVIAVFALTLLPWLQAVTLVTPVPLFSIIGMPLRRIPVRTVPRLLLMARQARANISCHEMESAYLQGVDFENSRWP